jgi:translocator protein
MARHDWPGLIGWVGLCVLVGAIAGASTTTDTDWYYTLRKPWFNPPRWVFAPVWTTLYVLMGIAAWRVWRLWRPRPALWLFVAQLSLNFAWSFIFFGAREIDLAFAEIVVLWTFVAATTMAFWRVDRVASWLMLPYLGWVSFAAILNGAIANLN